MLLTQAFRKKFVIPDFQSFCAHIDDLYDNAKNLSGGQVSAGGGAVTMTTEHSNAVLLSCTSQINPVPNIFLLLCDAAGGGLHPPAGPLQS